MKRSAPVALLCLLVLPGVFASPNSNGAIASAGQPLMQSAAQHLVAYISALQPWQSTGVNVKRGEVVTVQVVAGQWTARAGYSAYNSGEGESGPAPVGFPLPGYPSGSLIGQIGHDGRFFEVGHESTFIAQDSGVLSLQINDEGLSDNDGTLTVWITPSPPAPSTTNTIVALYPTGNAGVPPDTKVRFAWKAFPHAMHYAFHIWMVKQAGSVTIKSTTPVVFSTLVFDKTAYLWNNQGFLPGVYQYSLLPLNANGDALAPWCSPIQINIYGS